MPTNTIAIPAFSVGSIFLIVIVIAIAVAVAVFYFGVGSKLEDERGKTAPGDSPHDLSGRSGDEGERPAHTEVADETKATDENPSAPHQPLSGPGDR